MWACGHVDNMEGCDCGCCAGQCQPGLYFGYSMDTIWDLQNLIDRLRAQVNAAREMVELLPELERELEEARADLRKRREEDGSFRKEGDMAEVAQVDA